MKPRTKAGWLKSELGRQMGNDLAFKVGVIGLGLLSITSLTILVFSV
jgi:hypothetical protein